MNKQQFMRDLCKTFGTGGLICSFNDKELAEFHQFLEQDFPFSDDSKVKKGIRYAGRQEDGFWVVNPEVHINPSGQLVPVGVSQYNWQPIGGPAIDLIGRDTGTSISLQCDIKYPLESKESLKALLEAMQSVFKHNFVAGTSLLLLAVHTDSRLSSYTLPITTFTHYTMHAVCTSWC